MQQIQQMERLATGSRLVRLLHHPYRYFSTQAFLKFIYPRTRKGRLRTTRTFFDADMEVLLPAATDIYLTGGKTHSSEIRLAKFMIRELKEGAVFFDIGAHFGYFSLLAAKLVGAEGHVYSFEAASGTFQVLRKNTLGVSQVTAFHNAVSDSNGEISFYEFPVLYSEYNAMDIRQFEQEAWLKEYQPVKTHVAAMTIDHIVNEHGVQPDFIKIDVEGAEDKVLNGCAHTLANSRPVIVMEYINNSPNATVYKHAFSILEKYAYKSYIVKADGSLDGIDNIHDHFLNKNVSENIVFLKEGRR